jgi:hypothetical protein
VLLGPGGGPGLVRARPWARYAEHDR